jgi:hypothetical protein
MASAIRVQHPKPRRFKLKRNVLSVAIVKKNRFGHGFHGGHGEYLVGSNTLLLRFGSIPSLIHLLFIRVLFIRVLRAIRVQSFAFFPFHPIHDDTICLKPLLRSAFSSEWIDRNMKLERGILSQPLAYASEWDANLMFPAIKRATLLAKICCDRHSESTDGYYIPI